MKVLLDTCVWGGARDVVSSGGHDVIWAGDWPQNPGDQLVTLDKDFGELAVVRGHSHSGIVRLVDISATRQAAVCLWVLGHYGNELAQGAIVTVDARRVRIRS